MGVDLQIRIKAKAELTEQQRVDMEYHMRHRFRSILWPADSDYERAHISAAQDYAGGTDLYVAAGERMYEVPVWCRWYGNEYERGPALQIYGLLRYLMQHELVEAVYYGADSNDSYEEVTGEVAEALLSHFLKHGNLPYGGFFDQCKDGEMCCGHQMIRFGWGRNYAAWYCAGCGKEAVRENGKVTYRKEPR